MGNLINVPTFVSHRGSSLIDVALSTNPNNFQGSEVINIGSSDGHSMITVVAKTHLPKLPPKTVTYRSFRTFQKDKYRSDLQQIPFSVCEAFDDPSDALWAQNILIRDVLDQHAPLKTKTVWPFQHPFMNNILRKSIMTKARL